MSTLYLTQNQTSDYRIVIPGTTDAATENAAGELAAYLGKITGAALAVVTDEAPVQDKEIVVGIARDAADVITDIPALGEDGYIIRTCGDKLYLLGASGRGALYAVYAFLEKFAGCRFYASYYEKIPTTDVLTVPADTAIRDLPVFTVRNTFWADYKNDVFCAKRRANGRKFRGIAPEWGGSANWAGGACHTLMALSEMKTDLHFNVEPCLSDEGVYETVLKNVRQWLHDHPGARFISVSQNDSDSRGIGCMCDACRAKLERTGSYAGAYIEFVNRIADAIRDEFPDVMIHTFAYRFTRQAPIGVKPAPNVTVEMCTIEGCFRHPLDECDAIDDPHLKSDTFPVLLKKWSALSDVLSIWDYTTDFAHYALTFPNFAVLRENARLFAENHAQYIFEQGAYTTRNAEFCELRGYLFSHLLWDPYMEKEEYIRLADDFIDGYYGAGGKFVREYLRLAHEVTADHHMTVYDHPTVLYPNTKEICHTEADEIPLTAEAIRDYKNTDFSPYLTWYSSLVPHILIPKGYALFDAAIALTEDKDHREHLETSALTVTYLDSYYRRAQLDLMRENLTRVLGEVLSADGMAKEAQDTLISGVCSYVLAEGEAEYAAFNRRMYDDMIAHRCYDIREGFPLTAYSPEQLHFARDPLGWL
ncbi:MAG: DUF4838 domain-containing protein [Clostridia bacterium]|nr:DUF4838 domain-containing protein [Clostridia bacterium]